MGGQFKSNIYKSTLIEAATSLYDQLGLGVKYHKLGVNLFEVIPLSEGRLII